jgi:hypothetical protein
MKLSAQDCIRLNVHHLLLSCPRKFREKYGPRKDKTEYDRILTNRERNREHARSTRMRRKVFRQVCSSPFPSEEKF